MARITIDVPDHVLSRYPSPEVFACELRKAAALWWLKQGEMSGGFAAMIAGIDKFAFIDLAADAGIFVYDMTPEELAQELETLKTLVGGHGSA